MHGKSSIRRAFSIAILVYWIVSLYIFRVDVRMRNPESLADGLLEPLLRFRRFQRFLKECTHHVKRNPFISIHHVKWQFWWVLIFCGHRGRRINGCADYGSFHPPISMMRSASMLPSVVWPNGDDQWENADLGCIMMYLSFNLPWLGLNLH